MSSTDELILELPAKKKNMPPPVVSRIFHQAVCVHRIKTYFPKPMIQRSTSFLNLDILGRFNGLLLNFD